MGLFSRKKKKVENDFDDELGGGEDERDRDREREDEEGGGHGGPGGLAGGGSDENPYAEDPAHKHLVKLLDTNGLIRHRRAFIRNNVYTVEHAKKLDAGQLEKIGVFLEADRKKLLRIFKDSEVVESEVDKQREAEKEQEEKEKEKEKKSSKKEKKEKKPKKEKTSKKGKSKTEDEEVEEEEVMELDEKEEKKKKDKKKDKKKSKKSGKKDKPSKSDAEEELELDLSEDVSEKEKALKPRKEKPSKKNKKQDKGEAELADEIDGEIEAELKKKNEDSSKKSGKKERKKDKKAKMESKDFSDVEDIPESDIDHVAAGEEGKEDKVKESNKEVAEKPTPVVKADKAKQEQEKIDEVIAADLAQIDKERKLSSGEQALKLLEDKLQETSANPEKRPSQPSGKKKSSLDLDEELWWKSIDGNSGSEPEDFPEEKTKKKLKVKPKFGTKLEYITDEENDVLQSFRQQRKVSRRKRSQPVPAMPPIYPLAAPLPLIAPNQFPTSMPPIAVQGQKNMQPTTQVGSLMPPGQSTTSETLPPLPNQQEAVPNQVPIQSYPYWYYPPQPWAPNQYYVGNEDSASDSEDDQDYQHYKYFKGKYNEKRKKKALQKHENRQATKKKENNRKSKEEYVDLRKVEGEQFVKENNIWPDTIQGMKKGMVSDREVAVEKTGAKNVQKYGNDDHFFNFVSFPEEESNVKKGHKGKNDIKRKNEDVKYFSSSKKENDSNDSEMYRLRRKLAEVGASSFYPLLIKNGIMSLKNLDMDKLEKLPLASKSQKRALIKTLLSLKNSTKNLSEMVGDNVSSSEIELESNSKNLKDPNVVKGVLKKRSAVGISKSKSSRNRHYFSSEGVDGAISLAESDAEPDHSKVEPTAKKEESLKEPSSTVTQEDSKSDKKSVTFDLHDEDEISLPSYSDGETGAESDLSLYSDTA